MSMLSYSPGFTLVWPCIDVMSALENDVRPMCVEQVTTAVTVPATQRCDDFPSYQPCVDKGRNYMLDMDAYENKREAAKAGRPVRSMVYLVHTMADPIGFWDPSNHPHRFWAISDESDRFWAHFAHTTRSVLGLGLLLRSGFMSGVILPIQSRPTHRSDSPPAPPRIHPKCC